ncbi:MAG: twin-arginine translocation signal domain-containing protein [Verrucomicrobia bacterium]|nr:twin-arginine translocation signal domain-containing protein [Verrucomicrobiota bacterium]MBU1908753.1 twin-arginine translocation signal domain-containing protein [Verrucomicrobiota bacterium]
MKRRDFIKLTLAAAAALAAAGLGLLRRASPRCVLQAWRTRRYPGPVRALDETRVRQPGPWAG